VYMGYEEHETWIQYAMTYGTRSSSRVGKHTTRAPEIVLMNEKKKKEEDDLVHG
jgi:hypothetical protein